MTAIRRAIALSAAVAALLAAGCGEAEERKLTAQEFVAEMNRSGAALKLGPVLTQNPDGVDVNTVTISRTAPPPTGEGRPPASGDATLLVLADEEEAAAEYERCQGAPSLSCYRAANVVLRIEDLQPTDRALLTAAISELASDG